MLISHETDALLPTDLNAGLLHEAELRRRLLQLHGSHPNAHLIEKRVAGKPKGIGIADVSKAGTVVIGEAVTAVGDAGRGVQLGVRGEFAGLHPRHRRDRLPGAARVVGVHCPAEERLLGRLKKSVVFLLRGDQLREEIGIKRGLAGQRQDAAITGIQGHNRSARLIGKSLFGHPLKIQIDGEHQILTCHGRTIAEVSLHLAHGIHFQHLAAPLATQMTLIGRFDTDAANPVTDFVSLLRQCFVLLIGDRRGVTDGMGRQGAVGVITKDVHVHLGTRQRSGLLPETQNLLRFQIKRQGGAIAITIQAAAAAGVELLGLEIEKRRQTIAQSGPVLVADQTRFEIQGVGQLAGGENPTLAIQQATTDRRARHQSDAVLVGEFTKAVVLQKLHPDKPRHHRSAEQDHEKKQHQRLLTQPCLTLCGTPLRPRDRHLKNPFAACDSAAPNDLQSSAGHRSTRIAHRQTRPAPQRRRTLASPDCQDRG